MGLLCYLQDIIPTEWQELLLLPPAMWTVHRSHMHPHTAPAVEWQSEDVIKKWRRIKGKTVNMLLSQNKNLWEWMWGSNKGTRIKCFFGKKMNKSYCGLFFPKSVIWLVTSSTDMLHFIENCFYSDGAGLYTSVGASIWMQWKPLSVRCVDLFWFEPLFCVF